MPGLNAVDIETNRLVKLQTSFDNPWSRLPCSRGLCARSIYYVGVQCHPYMLLYILLQCISTF